MNMSFKQYLAQQLELHPAARVDDVVKLCYQAAFGAEHLLSDLDAARKYFDAEYQRTPASDGPLCEMISEGVCRVNLGAWKNSGMPEDWLFGIENLLRSRAADGVKQQTLELVVADAVLLA